MRLRLASIASMFAASVFLIPACKPSGSKSTKDPAASSSPVAMKGTGGDTVFKHGSTKGPGTGGGEKDAEGEKIGAGGFKHGSQKGGGEDGGGKKDGSGTKTAKKPEHGSGKGSGAGGGKRDGSGEDLGVLGR